MWFIAAKFLRSFKLDFLNESSHVLIFIWFCVIISNSRKLKCITFLLTFPCDFYCFFFVVLGIKPKASCMLGKLFTYSPSPSVTLNGKDWLFLCSTCSFLIDHVVVWEGRVQCLLHLGPRLMDNSPSAVYRRGQEVSILIVSNETLSMSFGVNYYISLGGFAVYW
jgi:hypothetical protein